MSRLVDDSLLLRLYQDLDCMQYVPFFKRFDLRSSENTKKTISGLVDDFLLL